MCSQFKFVFCFILSFFITLILSQHSHLVAQPADSSAFVSNPDGNPPEVLLTGQTVTVSIEMTNTGSTSWSKAGGYRLVSMDGLWSPESVDLGDSEVVAPGAGRTFIFEARAPYYVGVSLFQWRMYSDSSGFFGEASAPLTVYVVQNTEVPLYGMFEGDLIADAKVEGANLRTVVITYTGVSGDALNHAETREAFFREYLNGETQTRFSFRFSPRQSGDWMWEVTSGWGYSSSSSMTGLITVNPSTPLQGHIIVNPNNPWTFAKYDGTGNPPPWFMLGDTAWKFSSNDLPCPIAGCSTDTNSGFGKYVFRRSGGSAIQQKFNYIQGNLFAEEDPDNGSQGDNERGWPLNLDANNQYESLSNGYWNAVESRLNYMNARGIVVGISPGWGVVFNCSYHPVVGDNDLTLNWTCGGIQDFVHDVVVRLRDYNIIWLAGSNVLPGDNTICSTGCPGSMTFDQLAERIRSDDPDHLVSIHPGPGGAVTYPRWTLGAWHKFVQMQAQQCDQAYQTLVESTRASLAGSPRPVVNGEFGYETHLACIECKTGLSGDDAMSTCVTSNGCTGCTGACGTCDRHCQNEHHTGKHNERRMSWQIAMRGGFPVFGNTGIYNDAPDEGCLNTYIDSDGAKYMAYLYNFFNDLQIPVYWASPDFQPATSGSDSERVISGVNTAQNVQLVYYAQTGGNFPVVVPGVFETRGYNTLTGGWSGPVDVDIQHNGDVNLPSDCAMVANKLDFEISCDSEPARVLAATAGTFQFTKTCTLTALYNFSRNITMSCPGLPSEPFVSCSFSPSVVNPGGGSVQTEVTFTVDVSTTPASDYHLPVRGTADTNPAGLLGHDNNSITLRVLDFQPSCAALTIVNEGRRREACSANLSPNWDSTPISWECLATPTGSSCSISGIPPVITVDTNNPGGTSQGDHPMQIRGTVTTDAGAQSRTSPPFSLHVVDLYPNCDASVVVGGTDTVGCPVNPTDNWTDTTIYVSWSCTLPNAQDCIFNPNPWNYAPPNLINLTLNTTGMTVGNSQIQMALQASDGDIMNVNRARSFTLQIVDFQPDCPPAISVLREGPSTTVTCDVNPSDNWTFPSAQVTWICPPLVTGASCSFDPDPWIITSGPTVSLSVEAAANATLGDHYFQVSGTSGGQTRTDSTILRIQDYIVTCAETSLSVPTGQSRNVSCSIRSLNDFSTQYPQTIDLSCGTITPAPPAGNFSCVFSPSSITLGGGQTVPVTWTITPSVLVPPNNYSVPVQATLKTPGPVVLATRTFQTNVSVRSFSINCGKSVIQIPYGGTAYRTCTLTSHNSSSDPVSLECLNNPPVPPADFSCSFVPNPVPLAPFGSNTTSLTLHAGSTPTGTYVVTIKGMRGMSMLDYHNLLMTVVVGSQGGSPEGLLEDAVLETQSTSEEAQNLPPECQYAHAAQLILWPTDHQMWQIGIEGIHETDGDPVTVEIHQIDQDEVTSDASGSGVCPDAELVQGDTALVAAELNEGSDGRVYRIRFTATDKDGSCSGVVRVYVPVNLDSLDCVEGEDVYDSSVCMN